MKTAANELAQRLDAEVIQVIGRTTTLYRYNPDLERKEGAPPPWRQRTTPIGYHLDQLFFMRPLPGWSRYRTPIDGLFLCGAGTHPGGGVTRAPGYCAARSIRAHAATRHDDRSEPARS